MKNNKKIIIIIIIALFSVILFFLYKKVKDNVIFTLVGEESIVADFGSTYFDPGFVAKNGFGMDISSNVTITNPVNTYAIGKYEIKYELNYGNHKQELYRTVTVDVLDINKLSIILNGEEILYLLKDSKYNEEGAYVVNSISNDKFTLGNMQINGNVDINKIGVYDVNYVYTYNGNSISKIRKVEVFDIPFTISPNTLATKNVKISLNLESVNNYSNTKLPDGKTSLNKSVEYLVNKNGSYVFEITTKDDKKYKKIIEISNIIDDYKCTGIINKTGTKISVTPANDKVKKYEWIIDNKVTTGTSNYSEYKVINNAKVDLTFENGEKYQVNCLIEDKLIYHFKYDEMNTKPVIKCDSYTAQDRIKLEDMLKRAINEAGYGTRAGAVEAARFLVGGLDYKVRYQGPKSASTDIGRYNKVGLNIGNDSGWGCKVSGYIQGMDCTNFVRWVFVQNGLTNLRPYNSDYTDVRSVMDKVRVGDLLYTPCTRTDCKNDSKIDHVGIIIGIDNKYVYVAESTTGNINAIVVSKLEKNNMPAKGKFSKVHFTKYPNDGNVTNMWM